MDFVDLFCGMGTIRMGFEQAGHTCVYSVEWDKHKRRIYEVIFGHEPEGMDIRELRASDVPIADCWCFGAPCQDFSIAGYRAGLDGDRSSLVREVFRLIRETDERHRPKYLLYENVKGMFSSNGGWDYLGILLEMDELGYNLEWKMFNTADFVVPQNRERVFTVGHLRGHSNRKIFDYKCGERKANEFEFQERFRADIKPVFTISMSESTRRSIASGLYIRDLTPREYMRLQGVPDYITDKLIAAGISDTQLYRAAGDACTVNVIYEIARRLS